MIEIILGVIIISLIVMHTYTVNKMQDEIKSLARLVKSGNINDYIASERVDIKDDTKEEAEKFVPMSELSDDDFDKLVLNK